MRRFRFRLEKVREVKKTILDSRQRELALARKALEKEASVLHSAKETACRVRMAARQRIGGAVAAGEMATFVNYISYLEDFIRMQQRRVSAATSMVEECRTMLLEAHKETRMLDRLKERKMGEHQMEMLHAEQIIIDEIAGGLRANRSIASRI